MIDIQVVFICFEVREKFFKNHFHVVSENPVNLLHDGLP